MQDQIHDLAMLKLQSLDTSRYTTEELYFKYAEIKEDLIKAENHWNAKKRQNQ